MSATQDSQRPQSQQVYLPHRGKVRHTYSGEGVVQVVNGPGNDNNVVNVKPKGQHSCCQAHTYDTVMAVKLLQYSGVEQYFNMVFVFFFFFFTASTGTNGLPLNMGASFHTPSPPMEVY